MLKYLLNKGLLHGDCLTVTGKTLAENLEPLPGLKKGQDVIQTLENPIKSSGHLQILYGNLAPEGCVGKITGKEGLQFKGPARVFDSEEDMLKALDKDPMSLKVKPPGHPSCSNASSIKIEIRTAVQTCSMCDAAALDAPSLVKQLYAAYCLGSFFSYCVNLQCMPCHAMLCTQGPQHITVFTDSFLVLDTCEGQQTQ